MTTQKIKMKLIVKIGIFMLMPVMVAGCVTPKPSTPKEKEQQAKQMDNLNMYMLSNGHYIPN